MQRGTFDDLPADPLPGGTEEATGNVPFQTRPSLLAALDVPFKAFGTVAILAAPFFITGAVISGRPGTFASLFTLFELLQIAPAFLVAFAPAVRIVFTRYLIDDEGIRVHVQVLAKSESRVAWDKVTAIRHRVTLVDRILGIQRVDIIAYGERGTTLRLVGLRDAARLRDLAAKKMRGHASLGALLRSD